MDELGILRVFGILIGELGVGTDYYLSWVLGLESGDWGRGWWDYRGDCGSRIEERCIIQHNSIINRAGGVHAGECHQCHHSHQSH